MSSDINKSIAVLPFMNMSSNSEVEYFSDGITEEIINALAKILDLEAAVLKWSIDSEDIENVLKVETTSLKECYIPSLLTKHNLACVPMAD